MTNQLTPDFELLSTKDNNNVLTFPNDDYFFGKDGYLKRKYYNALNRLHRQSIIKFKGKYDGLKWCFNWVVAI